MVRSTKYRKNNMNAEINKIIKKIEISMSSIRRHL
jgi:hypothetical protein